MANKSGGAGPRQERERPASAEPGLDDKGAPAVVATGPSAGVALADAPAGPLESSDIGRRVQQVAERYAPAYVVVDAQHEVLHFSGRTGRYLEPAAGEASLNLLNLVHPDLSLDLRTALHKVESERRRIEVRNVRMDHEPETAAVNLVIEPLPDGDAPLTMMVIFQDAGRAAENGQLEGSGAARAEAALRASEGRFAQAQSLAGVGMWDWNPDTGESWWSPTVYTLWGLPVSDTPGDFVRLIHPQDRAAYAAALALARNTGELKTEWRIIRADGSERWLAATGRRDPEGGGARILGITQDVTERKLSETRLKLLLSELQHRVRNILAVVRSLVTQTLRSSVDLEDFASHLDGRLETLARTQGVVTRSPEGVVDLEELVREEMLAVAAREDQVEVAGPMVELRPEAAETFALALHELATNAVKYGALSAQGGKVSVVWRIFNTSGGLRLSLEWRESGVRALDIAPKRSGFGRELIERGLPFELGAATSLEFARGGVRAVLELPLAGNAVSSAMAQERVGME